MVVCVGVSNNTIGSIPDQERKGGFDQIWREVGKRESLSGRSRGGLWKKGDLVVVGSRRRGAGGGRNKEAEVLCWSDEGGGALMVIGIVMRRAVGGRLREAECWCWSE
jgi:hypothetical protein